MNTPASEPTPRGGRVGILKPDHLGDLVLSAPAIAALQRRFGELVLLCPPHNASLAGHLFPGIAARPSLMPHLDKSWSLDLAAWKAPISLFEDLDFLVCLRWDGFVQRVLDEMPCPFRAPELTFEQH